MAKIVIIDDEPTILTLMVNICKGINHQVFPHTSGREGLVSIAKDKPDLLVVDLKLDDIDGLQIIERTRRDYPEVVIIMVTGHGTIDTAVQAMKLGAYDYITKPFELEDFQRAVTRALISSGKVDNKTRIENDEVAYNGIINYKTTFVGQSDKVKEILKLVDKISENDGHVLIQGEFGSGKQTLARAIHNGSKRKDFPFKILACSSLPEDLLEKELFGGGDHPSIFKRSEGGTVLIDEIDLLPQRLQSMLDNFLEGLSHQRLQKSIASNMDFRFISTSNLPLDEVVNDSKFREDLYYRISIIPVNMPPLRRRKEDIMPLANHFLKNFSISSTEDLKVFDKFAEQILLKYNWPGNVDELQNAVQRACILSDDQRIRPSHLPSKVTQKIEVSDEDNENIKTILPIGTKLKEFIEKQEKVFIYETLRFNEGNREKTAAMLDVSIATLYRKMGLKLERDKILKV